MQTILRNARRCRIRAKNRWTNAGLPRQSSIVKAPFSACVDIDKPGGYANLMNCCKDSVSDAATAVSVQVPRSGTLPGVALP